uniref:Uncharacterized protein n=1 Tax=Oryza punctata TaxID=4537 RepID=A0A1V1H7Q4_ORYPU|nr:hypothetical protein [Oryza punctata]
MQRPQVGAALVPVAAAASSNVATPICALLVPDDGGGGGGRCSAHRLGVCGGEGGGAALARTPPNWASPSHNSFRKKFT